MALVSRCVDDRDLERNVIAARATTFARVLPWTGLPEAVQELQRTLDDTARRFRVEVGNCVIPISVPTRDSNSSRPGVYER
jgi:hypothetical protein